jgi:hypothetical protein
MATERSSTFIGTQIGTETAHGTGVAATIKLIGIQVTPQVKVDTKEIRSGNLFADAYALGRDWTEAKFEGAPYYEMMETITKSALCTGAGGVHTVSNTTDNEYTSYTFQVGNASYVESFTGGTFTGFNVKYTPEEITIAGDIIGNQMSVPGTWTAGIAAPTGTIILPGHCTVSVSGATQTRVLSAEFDISGRFKPLYVLNGSYTSVAMVETAPDSTVKIEVEADTEGIAHLTRLRAGNTAVNVILQATNGTRTFKIECACQVKELDSFKISDTTYNVAYTLGVVYSSTIGYAIKVTNS